MTKDYDGKKAHAGRMLEHLYGDRPYKEPPIPEREKFEIDNKGLRIYGHLGTALAARQEEWDPSSKLSLLFFAVEMAGECGEACNVAKKLEREALGLPGSRSTLEALGEELADVVISAYNTARRAGWDLDAAIERKFNKTSIERGFKTRLEMK